MNRCGRIKSETFPENSPLATFQKNLRLTKGIPTKIDINATAEVLAGASLAGASERK